MKASGADISKHLLIHEYSKDPPQLSFDLTAYTSFRDQRFQRMWEILSAAVNPEVNGA